MQLPDLSSLLNDAIDFPRKILDPVERPRVLRWGAIFFLALYLVSRWQANQLPPTDDILESMLVEPTQTETKREPFTVEKGGMEYLVTPLYDYELYGMVVSYSTAHTFDDIYHRDWKDHLNMKDLAVIWGDNLESGIYHKLKFHSDAWMAYVKTRHGAGREEWDKFRMEQLSNNHLLTEDAFLCKQILNVRRGDQIRFKGVLAEYSHSNGAFTRGSSTTRTDTGNGACETVYVDEFEVLSSANLVWRHLKGLSFYLMFLCGIASFVFFLRAPIISH